MKEPLVSVSVVTYNHKDYIAQCLDNILKQQTSFSFEIILGEDESSDGTREICKAYAENYPDKIKLFLRRREDVIFINGNPTGRYNFIENLKACKGKYIALCEGDDYWTDPLKLQKQVDFLEINPNCFMITHDMPGWIVQEEGMYNKDKLFDAVYLPHTSNYLFRKFDLKKYWRALHEMPTGDNCLLYIAVNEGFIYHSKEMVSYYRRHDGGIYSIKSQEEKRMFYLKQQEAIMKHFKVDKIKFLKRAINTIRSLTNPTVAQLLKLKYYQILFFTITLKRAIKTSRARI